MSVKGMSGAEAGKVYAERFLVYIAEREASGTLPWGPDGKLIRSVMVRDLGVNRDVFRTNPTIRDRLAEIEGSVNRSALAAADQRASGHRSQKEVVAVEKVKELQGKIAQIEEENRYLKAELRKKGYVDLTLPNSGRLPW
ncbi:hypothetical protein [Methylosinus sp. PW1]|uniref:hypothetical protein n=1 Tax=Methylosinus sp. PW1 TaxID=107636 RepID=UPI000567ADF6|nr:hypothetical protein [Methylosinus sp. PW1]